MRRVYRPTLAGRIVLGILGVALVLLGPFLLAVASFADGSTGERVVTIVVAVLITALGAVQRSCSASGSSGTMTASTS